MHDIEDKHRRESDMREAAINRRMRKLGQLYELAQSLRRARPVSSDGGRRNDGRGNTPVRSY